MKGTGVEWIGEIPNHWEVVPSNLFFYNSSEKINADTNEKIEQLTASQKYGVISQRKYMELETQTPVQKQNLDDLKRVNKNDFVISLRSFEGGIEIAQESGGITPAYTVIKEKTNKTKSKYYKYLFKSNMYIQALRGTVLDTIRDGKSIKYRHFSMVPIVLPPVKEQEKIVEKLDELNVSLDKIVDETKQSIEELKKYKNSIITEVVTKGLDSNVEMQDSGIEWLEEVPIDWDIKKTGNLFYQVKDKNTDMQEKNLLSLSYGSIIKKDINTSDGLLPASFSGYNIVRSGDIVLRMTDLQNDKNSLRTGYVSEQGIITSAYITIRTNHTDIVNPKYIQLFLHSFDIYKGFYGMGSGVRQNVTFNDIKKLHIILPSKMIQDEIVKYVEKKAANIDNLVAEKEKVIEELEKYKKSLTYEYVTGKKEL
jgi:type I restriction enzyme, S subunit